MEELKCSPTEEEVEGEEGEGSSGGREVWVMGNVEERMVGALGPSGDLGEGEECGLRWRGERGDKKDEELMKEVVRAGKAGRGKMDEWCEGEGEMGRAEG